MKGYRMIIVFFSMIALLIGYIVYSVLKTAPEDRNLTPVQYVNKYAGLYYSNPFKKKKAIAKFKRISGSKDQLARYAAVSFVQGKLPVMEKMKVRIDTNSTDYLILSDLFNQTTNMDFRRMISAENYYLKSCYYELFRRNNFTNSSYLSGNDDYYQYMRKLGLFFYDENINDFSREILENLIMISAGRDVELRAWLGSLLTKRAMLVNDPIYKMRLTSEGIEILDGVVFDNPESLNARVIRVNNYLALPVRFGKREMIDADLKFLIDSYQSKHKLIDDRNWKKKTPVELDKALMNQLLESVTNSKYLTKDEKNKYTMEFSKL